MACIIVRRLLISVHKWQSLGMAATHEYWSKHDAHLVYLVFTNFLWAKSHIFFRKVKIKIHRNVQHLLKTCPCYTL